MSHPDQPTEPGHCHSGSHEFHHDGVRSSLRRIVTSTYLRGVGRIVPNPHQTPGTVPSCHDGAPEGPAVAIHGLASAVASTPLHFVAILEPGERVALSRFGFHRSRVQVLYGRCRITCVDLGGNRQTDHPHPVRTWNPKARGGLGTIRFPIELRPCSDDPAHAAHLDAGDFPEDDRHILYVESLDGASVLLASRTVAGEKGCCASGKAGQLAGESTALEAPPAWAVYASSSCSPGCVGNCPHALAFAGQMAPAAHHV
jgi:hypothetical protein